MLRIPVLLLMIVAGLSAGPARGQRVPLLDLRPAFFKSAERLRRNRSKERPGLFCAGKRYRGLNVPASARLGFDLDAAFQRFEVKVGVLDGGRGAVRFKVLGDGKVLAATPPLFPGAAPVALEVSLERVLLLELVSFREGSGGSRGAWLEGTLESVAGRDLGGGGVLR